MVGLDIDSVCYSLHWMSETNESGVYTMKTLSGGSAEILGILSFFTFGNFLVWIHSILHGISLCFYYAAAANRLLGLIWEHFSAAIVDHKCFQSDGEVPSESSDLWVEPF